MKKINTLIIVASWEDRCYLGVKKTLETYLPNNLIMFFYREYKKLSGDNRRKITQLCKKKKISIKAVEIGFEDPANTWKTIDKLLIREKSNFKNALVDITTMPRDSIYNILYFLDQLKTRINFIYYKPKEYNDEWLSRDPGRPRFIFKHSGITRLGQKTVLVILTGFDVERTEQLIYFYEPSVTLVGFQMGPQFNNDKRNLNKHKIFLPSWKAQTKLETFYVDAYSKDNGYKIIESKIKKYVNNSNVILSSLGPKPSAVSLYRISKKFPQVALAYAPSKEFNPDYSAGIGKKIFGKI